MVRWGLVGAACLAAAALVLTSLASYRRTQAVSRDLVAAQGGAYLESLQRLAARGELPTSEDLAAWLADFSDSGITFVELGGPAQVSAGTRTDALMPPLPPLGPGIRTQLGDGIARVTAYRPMRVPRRVRRDDPERALGGPTREARQERRERRRRARLARAIVEFEPVAAQRLVAGAERNLAISGAVAVALIALSAVMAGWMRRREQLERELTARHHLARLGETSAVLAHEIRNPLASLKGHAQLLEASLPEGKPRDKAHLVVGEAIRIEELTAGLLEFVRTGAVDRAPVPPADVLRDAARDAGADRIDVDDTAAPPLATIDGPRLRQVLGNLLKNAVQASPEGARVGARCAADGTALVFEVRDRGTGVPVADRERIFEPFTTGRTRGTGLGLAVARRIVEAHGGTVTVGDPNDGAGGAVFTVSLPGAANE